MELAALAPCLGLNAPSQSPHFFGVCIDGRKIRPGELFYALPGEQFDGHEYLDQAAAGGAVAAVVSRPVTTHLPTLLVPDTRIALGQHAKAWRAQFELSVIALTGSVGKTTVKQIIATILQEAGPTLATQGNFNNDLGAPLTLLNLTAEHQYAVIELGANHPGEIAYTTELVKPNVALVNNVGAAHLEGFGGIEGVAKAKGEIFNALAKDGTAVINLDDAYAAYYQEKCRAFKQLTFGLTDKADITAKDYIETAHGWSWTLVLPTEEIQVQFPLPGIHNVRNALAAAAAVYALGLDAKIIQAGLAKVVGVPGRMQRKSGKNKQVIIDDTYNANPTSTKAAIDYLAQCPNPQILILGDMGELGQDCEQLHHSVGVYAHEKGIGQLLTCGVHSVATAKGYGDGARHFASQQELIEFVQHAIPHNAHCLVKGSRSARMENVVRALVEGC